eukprot:scaffold807_cov67-Phaeocystis_antarctica.AAC.3
MSWTLQPSVIPDTLTYFKEPRDFTLTPRCQTRNLPCYYCHAPGRARAVPARLPRLTIPRGETPRGEYGDTNLAGSVSSAVPGSVLLGSILHVGSCRFMSVHEVLGSGCMNRHELGSGSVRTSRFSCRVINFTTRAERARHTAAQD